MANLRFVSGYNGYLPQFTAQVVAHIRKPDEFAINRYVKFIPTPTKVAYYIQLGFDAPVRVFSDAQMAWADGAARDQMGEDNGMEFQDIPFRTFRRNRAWTLGWQSIQQTKEWKLKQSHVDMCISQIMTNRTNQFAAFATNTANWGTNYQAATVLNNGAGKWAGASDNPSKGNYLAIFRTIQAAVQYVHLRTNGMLKAGDFRFVMSPGTAIAVSTAPELVNYCRESPYAKSIIEQGLDPQFAHWGMPARYKGYEFVVEDSMIVTQQANTTDSAGSEAVPPNRTYCWPDGVVAMVARPGAIDGTYGEKDYSTLQLFHFGNLLEVEAFDDPENHRVKGHVSEDTKQVAISATGMLITGVI